ncbi:hypothetical protein [Streptomyces sp. NPDC005435]
MAPARGGEFHGGLVLAEAAARQVEAADVLLVPEAEGRLPGPPPW